MLKFYWSLFFILTNVLAAENNNCTLSEFTRDVACKMAMNECASQSVIMNYVGIYYCSMYNNRALYIIFILVWLLILFYVMYRVSDRYLAGSLEVLAGFCKLSPSVAGVTFLAFGNGAPDLFTALSGVVERPGIIFGSSIGSGLFTLTIVFGTVVLFSRISQKTEKMDIPLSDLDGSESTLPCSKKTIISFLQETNDFIVPTNFIKNGILYVLSICALFTAGVTRYVPIWLPILFIIFYVIHLSLVLILQYRDRLRESIDDVDTFAVQPPEEQMNWKNMFLYAADYFEYQSMGLLMKILFFVTLPLELVEIITIPPILSEDAIDEETRWKMSHLFVYRVRLVLFPICSSLLFLYFAAGLKTYGGALQSWAIALIIGALLSLIMIFVSDWKGPIRFRFLIVLLSFAMCIVWIYGLSNEVVGVLVALSNIFEFNDAVLGIIILAWGNTFGDLVADLAIAKAGNHETAVTSVFCSPIQNILLTLGISFINMVAHEGSYVASFTGTEDFIVAFSVLASLMLLHLFIISVVFQFRIPRYYGLISIGIYLLYLPIGILLGLGVFNPNKGPL